MATRVFVLCSFLIVSLLFVRVTCNVCHSTPVDAIFLLDSSGSMSLNGFQMQLDFVVNFTNYLTIGPNDFQIGVVTFSTEAYVEFHLNNFTDKTALHSAIKSIEYKSGWTYTNLALGKIPEMFMKSNGGGRLINNKQPARFVYLLTDGMSDDRAATIDAATKIKDQLSLKISAIGVGNGASYEELVGIASKPEFVYTVEDIDSIHTVLMKLVNVTCENIDECSVSSPCKNGSTCINEIGTFRCICAEGFYGVLCDTDVCHPTPADVIFLLDSSISMTEDQFQKQLDFVVNFTNHVNVGPDDFQIGVVTFSFKAHVEFFLNNYTDNADVQSAIRGITYKPGATFTNKALDKVPELFHRSNGGERLINHTQPAKFVFLLTDGMSTEGKATVDAASSIKHLELKISTIGVGNEVSHKELLDIATKSELVYSVQDFDSLYTVLKQLVYITCEKCWRSSKTDVAIFLDTSSRVSEQQFHASLDALSYFIDLVDLDDKDTRVSMTSFDVKFREVFDFGEYSSKNDMQIKINRQRRLTSTSQNLVDVLQVLRFINESAFIKSNKDKNGSKRLAVLFTNGKSGNLDASELRKVKTQIYEQNITVVCVASGPDVDLYPLYDVVNDAFDVYVTDDDNVSKLRALNSYITYHVCELDGN